jgi:DNA topoisomerase-3
LKSKWVKPNKRIFDNSKISDHFAIIPTLQRPKSLNELDQAHDLVVKRFLRCYRAEYCYYTLRASSTSP